MCFFSQRRLDSSDLERREKKNETEPDSVCMKIQLNRLREKKKNGGTLIIEGRNSTALCGGSKPEPMMGCYVSPPVK